MKVLYFTDFLTASGGERQLMSLLHKLDRARFTPSVLVLHDEQRFPYHFRQHLLDLDIPLHSLEMPFPPRTASFIQAVGRYTRLMWHLRPDVVQGCLHVSNLVSRAARPFTPPHRLLNMVQSLHTPKRMAVEYWSAFLADQIIANSAHNYHHLMSQARFSARRVSAINCGVEVAHFARNTAPHLREALFPDADYIALMVARIDPVKGHETVLEALHLLQRRGQLPPGFRLVLLGQVFSEAVQARIEAQIADYQLAPFVVQLAPVDDTAPYFHLADVVLLASLREGFGLVVIEALAAGKPVIASEAANPLGAVVPGQTGWVFPTQDVEALADCLRQGMAATEEELADIQLHARRVAEAYDAEKMAQAYMALYTA